MTDQPETRACGRTKTHPAHRYMLGREVQQCAGTSQPEQPKAAAPDVAGRCPACRGESLMLADGGHITCRRLECPNPEAAQQALETPAAGYCPHCGRGDAGPTADEYEQQRQRAEQAEAALANLHAGEAEPPDELVEPTPAQWLWQWNRATPEQRLGMAGRILSAFAESSACFLQDHRGAVAYRQSTGPVLHRVRAEVDRWMGNTLTPQTRTALSDILRALDPQEPAP